MDGAQPSIATTADERIPSLDGWRAMAVSLVLVSHLTFTHSPPVTSDVLVPLGDLGVRIFFVLSGFLISLLLLREASARDDISLKRFYTRRALRILPIYAAYLLVLALLSAIGLYRDQPSSWIGAATFTRNLIGQGRSATVHFWSLAIEEQFYLLWPVTLTTFRLWRRPKLLIASLLAVIVVSLVFRWRFLSAVPGGSLLNRLLGPKSGLAYADSLVIGCLGAWFMTRSPRVPPRLVRRLLIASALALIAAAEIASYRVPGRPIAAIVPTVQALSFMLLIWLTAFVPGGAFSSLLNLRAVALVGVWSYSLYVWHVVMLAHFIPALEGVWLYHWTVWWISVFVLATTSYYCLERPMLKLKARFRWDA